MKRFFDLSMLLLLPIFLFSTLSNEAVTTEPTFSSEAHEIFEILSTESTVIMSLEDIQAALDNKEISAEAMPPQLCGGVECYTASWLTRFLGLYGTNCNGTPMEAPYNCFDVDGDDCIGQVDLAFFLENFCD